MAAAKRAIAACPVFRHVTGLTTWFTVCQQPRKRLVVMGCKRRTVQPTARLWANAATLQTEWQSAGPWGWAQWGDFFGLSLAWAQPMLRTVSSNHPNCAPMQLRTDREHVLRHGNWNPQKKTPGKLLYLGSCLGGEGGSRTRVSYFVMKSQKPINYSIKTMGYKFHCFTWFLTTSTNLVFFPYNFPYNETKIRVSSPSNSAHGQSQQTHSATSHQAQGSRNVWRRRRPVAQGH